MAHKTLKAIYKLDVAQLGQEEADKLWTCQFQGLKEWEQYGEVRKLTFDKYLNYKRNPKAPWPKVPRKASQQKLDRKEALRNLLVVVHKHFHAVALPDHEISIALDRYQKAGGIIGVTPIPFWIDER